MSGDRSRVDVYSPLEFFGGAGQSSPFLTGLGGGNLAFDGRRPLLKQWLDVSGPSLVALRIRAALGR